MTDEELRALARATNQGSWEASAAAQDVLVDALVECGEIAGASEMTRTQLHLAAAEWAWRNRDDRRTAKASFDGG